MAESGEQFLHRKDPMLHTTLVVEHEQARRKKTKNPVSQRPADRITAWLGVVEQTHMGHKDDPRIIERIKDYYHREYVIRPENIPQQYWNLRGEIVVSEGRKQDLVSSGVRIEETTVLGSDGKEVKKRSFIYPQEVMDPAVRVVISNQQQSLDRWANYLTSSDTQYPMWAKYWTFRSIVKMGKFEKAEDGRARFASREKDTVASFPVLNQRALAKTIGVMNERLQTRGGSQSQQSFKNSSAVLSDSDYQKLLNTEDFSKLYTQFLTEIPEYSTVGLEETRGSWIKYPQWSDARPLVKSLEGYPLEWCTADRETAQIQLQGGDFYVYYSWDEEGNSVVPRLAIRMEENKIAESPRGIAPKQNLDPYISDVLEEKLVEFGSEGKAYKKRVDDMRQLTAIERKARQGDILDGSDLAFLYEIDFTIEGFGYEKDLRIAEILAQRNQEEDMLIVFGCEKRQIARSTREIGTDIKAYVGKLEPGIFDLLAKYNIEQIYTSFPEGKIRIEDLAIGGRSKEQLLEDLKQGNFHATFYADDMIKSPKFTTLPNPETIKTIRLKVSDLGFSQGATTDEMYSSAQKLGLELCLPEVALYQRLKDTNQFLDEWYCIAMKQISGSDGDPCVFGLVRNEDGMCLYDSWAFPDGRWSSGHELVFSLRKHDNQNT